MFVVAVWPVSAIVEIMSIAGKIAQNIGYVYACMWTNEMWWSQIIILASCLLQTVNVIREMMQLP